VPVGGAVGQVGRGDELSSAGTLEQAVTLTRVGVLAGYEQPGLRGRAGPGADGQHDDGVRAEGRVGQGERGTAGNGRLGQRGRTLGVIQGCAQIGDRLITVSYQQGQADDRAQAGQQDQDDRDPSGAWSRPGREDIQRFVHRGQSRLPVSGEPRGMTSL
jgi:hypothetical protein